MQNLTTREEAIRANLTRFGSASLFGYYDNVRYYWNLLVDELGTAVIPYLEGLRDRNDFDLQAEFIDEVAMADLTRWAWPLF